MLILVTGGNGFIGSHVVRKLIENGHQVRCTLRAKSDLSRLKGLPCEKVIADVRNRLSILEAVNGCDAIIHCASLSNWSALNSPDLKSIILTGTQNLIDAAIAQNARMVYVSSAAALGANHSPMYLRNGNSQFNLPPKRYRYAAFKAEADKLCMKAVEQQGADIMTVHPTETYGAGDEHFVTASTLVEFVAGPVCLTVNGGTSVVHVEDVATGIVAACEKGKKGTKYVLGGENLTVSQMAALTQRICGTNYREIRLPRRLLLFVAYLLACTPFVKAKTLSTKYRYAAHYWFFDTRETTEALGLTFRSAEATFESTINWLKQHPHGIRTNSK